MTKHSTCSDDGFVAWIEAHFACTHVYQAVRRAVIKVSVQITKWGTLHGTHGLLIES
jgi:hypothetical protein